MRAELDFGDFHLKSSQKFHYLIDMFSLLDIKLNKSYSLNMLQKVNEKDFICILIKERCVCERSVCVGND